MKLDSLSTDHELESPEPQPQLDQEEESEDNIDGSVQGEDDGVHIHHQVEGEWDLEEGQQPEASKLGHLQMEDWCTVFQLTCVPNPT